MREATYFTVYFPLRIGEIANEIRQSIDEFLDLAPGVTLGHAGVKPCAGCYKRDLKKIRREALGLLEQSRALGEDDNVHVAFKDGMARDYSSEAFHFLVYGENLVHIASQRATLPNYVQCYFPIDLNVATRKRFIQWFQTLVERLGACYGFINPVLDYDMFHPQREIKEILSRLKTKNALDVFDDFNHHRHLLDHVKGPMWITALSPAHLASLGCLRSTQEYSVNQVGDITYVTLEADPTVSQSEDVRINYTSLAETFKPITIASFDPIMLRFPYKYPHKYSHLWLRRFRTDDWAKCSLPSV